MSATKLSVTRRLANELAAIKKQIRGMPRYEQGTVSAVNGDGTINVDVPSVDETTGAVSKTTMHSVRVIGSSIPAVGDPSMLARTGDGRVMHHGTVRSSTLGSRTRIVCTSTTHPATPLVGDEIFELDTGNTLIYQSATTGWTPPWNTAWGLLGDTIVTTAVTGVQTGFVDLVALTWTNLAANRFLRYVLSFHPSSATANQFGNVQLVDGANTLLGEPENSRYSCGGSAGNTNISQTLEKIEAGAAVVKGSMTRKMQGNSINTNAVTFYADGNYAMGLRVYDVGPSGPPV